MSEEKVNITNLMEGMVFHPTLEELRDFPEFIKTIESKGAHKAGIAKIIPPDEWVPRKCGYQLNKLDRVIRSPIRQVVEGKTGLYKIFNFKMKNTTVCDYHELAESSRYRAPHSKSSEDLERIFWKNIGYISPIYGADVSGSLMDEDLDVCNTNNLGTILDLVSEECGTKIAGVNTAYLYFGMWKAMFAWHTEDVDLYSINYIHTGAGKTWYVIPPGHGRRFEETAKFYFHEDAKQCEAFLRHKSFMVSPSILRSHCIPYSVMRQKENEIIVTFPYAYHAGFNHGFNIAESTNFASPRWIDYGKWASKCFCREDSVKIEMDTFIRRFQPEKYQKWLCEVSGIHPEHSTKCYHNTRKSLLKNSQGKRRSGDVLQTHEYFDPISKVTVFSQHEGVIKVGSPFLQPRVVVEKLSADENELIIKKSKAIIEGKRKNN